MKLKVVVVYDSAANVYGQPQFVTTVGGAIRSFGDEVNRQSDDNVMCRHSADFMLYELGVYDDNSGLFETGVPTLIARGADFK